MFEWFNSPENQPRRAPCQVPNERDLSRRIIITAMANMELIEPSLLRAASPHRGIRAMAAVVLANSCSRMMAQRDLDYRSSSAVASHIGQFWSHSWHGSKWNKLLLVLAMKNGLPAVLAGTLSGSIAMTLFLAGILPGLPRPTLLSDGPLDFPVFSCWSTIAAWLTALLTLLFWRGSGSVFLDCICVNQSTGTTKAKSVASIGAFLRRSNTMLVMWDPTFCQRLWCRRRLSNAMGGNRGQPLG